MKTSSIIFTALLAGTACALVGTLLAPGKGSKTRNSLAKKSREYRDYLQDNFDDFSNSVSYPFESLEEETIRLGKEVLAKTKKIKEGAKHKSKLLIKQLLNDMCG